MRNYRLAPGALSDAPDIHALISACERSMYGRVQTDLTHVTADLTRPGVEPAKDVRLVRGPEGTLTGWAWVKHGRRCAINVHPEHTGRGLGSALLDWAEERSRELGSDKLGQTVPDRDTGAAELLTARGYNPIVHCWLLENVLATDVGEPVYPEGISIRAFRAEDAPAMFDLYESAFETIQTSRYSFEEWSTLTIKRAAFAPESSPVAFAGDELVGLTISLENPETDEGYVDQLAVREDFRGRGIAKALLRKAFREFHLRGRSTTTIWTHSDTGALPLYESIGMTVRRSDTVYRGVLERS